MAKILKMRVPYITEGMMYDVIVLQPTVIQVVMRDADKECNFGKNYHFNDESSANIFCHMAREMIAYQKYESYRSTGLDYAWHGTTHEDVYNARKSRKPQYFKDVHQGELEYDIKAPDLFNQDSEIYHVFDFISISGEEYSGIFTLETGLNTWYMGWKNADFEKKRVYDALSAKSYRASGAYLAGRYFKELNAEVPRMLSCIKICNLTEPERRQLEAILPGYIDWKQQTEKKTGYPYDKYVDLTQKKFRQDFAKFYTDYSTRCRKDCCCPYDKTITVREGRDDPLDFCEGIHRTEKSDRCQKYSQRLNMQDYEFYKQACENSAMDIFRGFKEQIEKRNHQK